MAEYYIPRICKTGTTYKSYKNHPCSDSTVECKDQNGDCTSKCLFHICNHKLAQGWIERNEKRLRELLNDR